MHHVRVALDPEALGDLDRADLGDAAGVVAAEVEQLHVLGDFLLVGQEFLLEREVLGGVAPRLRVPAIGRTVTMSSSSRARISG